MKNKKMIGTILLICGLILLGLGMYYQFFNKNDKKIKEERNNNNQVEEKIIINEIKWGTSTSIPFYDIKYGKVDVLALGNFSYEKFNNEFTNEYIEDNIRIAIVMCLQTKLTTTKGESYTNLPSIMNEYKQQFLDDVNNYLDKEEYKIIEINILSIKLTEESKTMINDMDYDKLLENE